MFFSFNYKISVNLYLHSVSATKTHDQMMEVSVERYIGLKSVLHMDIPLSLNGSGWAETETKSSWIVQ